MPIILASASPRRREILTNLGLSFQIQASQVEEKFLEDMEPGVLAQETALAKARDVAKNFNSGLVIGADTIVVLNDQILGKPASVEEAQAMLQALNGKEHLVISGLAVVDVQEQEETAIHEITKVWFRQLDDEEIQNYVATGEPMDKAGAYGIQDKGSLLVAKIEGCYFNVVGLPLSRLYLLLKQKGIKML